MHPEETVETATGDGLIITVKAPEEQSGKPVEPSLPPGYVHVTGYTNRAARRRAQRRAPQAKERRRS